jgi:ribosomal protein S1
MNSKKFWRKKVVYDFVRTKQRAERKEEAASTRWERNVTVALSDLQQGQWLPGKVRNLQPFGAWIDIGAERDGLLHVSDMSEGFTPSVADAVYTGQVLNVTVKFVDAGASKLALSLVPLTSGAAAAAQRGADGGPLTAEPLEAVEAGDELWGEVVKVTNFGAYVECGVDVQGFLHITEWPAAGGRSPNEVFSRGQRLRTWVLQVDSEASRLKLTGERPDYLPRIGGGSGMLTDTAGDDDDY